MCGGSVGSRGAQKKGRSVSQLVCYAVYMGGWMSGDTRVHRTYCFSTEEARLSSGAEPLPAPQATLVSTQRWSCWRA